ncbi:Hypothetical protein KVN_LOCUS529 [uncultured virus]|nr:Hypothetical protein KVN_LOCUS529 [uncultured virus]
MDPNNMGKSHGKLSKLKKNINFDDSDNDEIPIWKILYDILKKQREKLPDFLLEHGGFDELKQILLKIEENKKEKFSIIRDLFLGKVGNENNKQKAIYELPTNELINVINTICMLLSIDKIEEICCGQGILAKMLQLKTSLEIKATDGFRWIETFGQPYYINVENKLILDYVNSKENLNEKLIIFSWFPDNAIDDFFKFIEKNKPKQFCIIGEYFTNIQKSIFEFLENDEYHLINLQTKQICYKDYYYLNKNYPENNCRSSMTLCFKNNELTLQLIKIASGQNNFCSEQMPYSDKMFIQDLIITKVFPKWITDTFYDDLLFKKYVNIVINCLSRKYKIPQFIDNPEDFEFWFEKMDNNQFPKKINDSKKFKEYKQLANILESENGLDNLKNNFIVPDWILNINEAYKYIWLDFSTDNKQWKQSKNNFMRKFGQTYNNNNLSNSIFYNL